MIICGQCGTSSEGAKFCPECGVALAVSERPVAEERKVVTALFCDLVGFTSLSETADPEDVNTMLDAYSAMARSQIENHGGIVQKFIGDAVVGVFGVPAAHEDDPERAVRPAFGSSRQRRGWRRWAARRCGCAWESTAARRWCGST